MVEDYSDREQEEALRAWIKDNWRWMAGGVLLGVGLLVGYNYWGQYREQRAAKAAVLYEDMRQALTARDVDKADKVLADMAKQFSSAPYTQEARLQLAKAKVGGGKYDEAVVLLNAVVKDSDDKELRQIAQVRHARLLVQQGKHDEALALLKPDDNGIFAAQFHEVRGDALFAKGDNEGARAAYAAALKGSVTAVDRSLVELKLQEAGGTAPPAESTNAAKVQP